MEEFNPLNVILAQLSSATNDGFWLVDDGSVKVERYIRNQLEKYLTEGYGWYTTAPVQKKMVVRFSDPYRAANFVGTDEEALGVNIYTSGYHYGAQDIFGTTVAAVQSFNRLRAILIATEVLLLIVAVIVAVMTFAHLIDSDAATVALYRAMGASTDEIYVIYLLYLVELCLLAMIGLMLAVGASLVNMEAMEQVFALGFGVTERAIWLVGWNDVIWWLTGVMLLTAVVTVVLGNGNFTSRELVRKMK